MLVRLGKDLFTSTKPVFAIPFLALFLLVACAGETEVTPTPSSIVIGDAAGGEALFKQTTITSTERSVAGCPSCHSLEAEVVLVGPSLAAVASRAGERVPDLPSGEYLRESIVSPNAYVVEGFSPDVMYQQYAQVLSDKEITDLVAFLMTLE